jgi:hypothetical protein
MPQHTEKRKRVAEELKTAARLVQPGQDISLRAVMEECGVSWQLVREVAIELGLWRRSAGHQTIRRRGVGLRVALYRQVAKAARRKGISPEEYAERAVMRELARDKKAGRRPGKLP